jgi:aldose 1-epimerase
LIARSLFGTTPDGRNVYNYTFIDEKGQSAVITEYACAIVQLNVLDKYGKIRDVALGYDTLNEYLNDTRCFGATVGRYANRIAKGQFTLNGVTYHLPINNGPNTLHGGPQSFRKRVFDSEMHDDSVTFTINSPDLDCGFPGNFTLKVHVTFNDGDLRMNYEYVCDKDCPVNITNHNYFNLNGHGHGNILNHYLVIHSDKYCKADDNVLALAPTVSVENTPFDFRVHHKISTGILSNNDEIIRAGGGYDHCFELSDKKNPAAIAKGDESGIVLNVSTDMPAIQFYTGNSIGHCRGKNGAFYNNYDGFALECQQFPNAVNEPSFPNAVIKSGQLTHAFISYSFTC